MFCVNKYIRIILIIYLFLSVLPVAEGQGTAPYVLNGGKDAVTGIYIEKIDGGEVVVEFNQDRLMVPASILKVLTSATALSVFNPDGTFITPVIATGGITNGTIGGDLIISTIGDPTLESRHFPENLGFADNIVKEVKRLGVNKINGSVIVDESNFIDATIPQGWLDEDIKTLYGAGLYASNFRDNHVVIKLPSKETVPYTPGLKINISSGKGALRVERKRDSNVYEICGKIPAKGFASKYSNPAPGTAMRAEVIARLRDSGIEVSDSLNGSKVDGKDVYLHHSPTVIRVLRSLMFRSDNMMAEGMLRAICPGLSRVDAIRSEFAMWKGRGIDLDGMVVKDGSGLSRMNRVTPRFMADILRWMANSEMCDDYVSLFPKAGMEGTMRNFLKDTPLQGKLAMKTGSMRGVQCFAGYMLGDNGKPSHIVVVMVNDFSIGRSKLRREISNFLLRSLDENWVSFEN